MRWLLAIAILVTACQASATPTVPHKTPSPCEAAVAEATLDVKDVTALDRAIAVCESMAEIKAALAGSTYLDPTVTPEEFIANRCDAQHELWTTAVCDAAPSIVTPADAYTIIARTRNEAIAKLKRPKTSASVAVWRTYLTRWAAIEDAFVTDLLKVRFPAAIQPTADDLIAAEVKVHRVLVDAAAGKTRISQDLALADADGPRADASAAAELLRSKLGLPRPAAP